MYVEVISVGVLLKTSKNLEICANNMTASFYENDEKVV